MEEMEGVGGPSVTPKVEDTGTNFSSTAAEVERADSAVPLVVSAGLHDGVSAKTLPTTAVLENESENLKKTGLRTKYINGFLGNISTRISNMDRRFCYLLGMLVSILHPILALWVVTYEDCPLDDLGYPVPDYEPPKPCALDANGEKTDPSCIDPPQAYARVENICYMYLVNEFALHVTYVLYVKVWTLGGRSAGRWRELSGYAGYFIVEFIVNAAPYHVQTFPRFRKVFPFLNSFTWPLYAAFIFGSILLLPLGLYLAKTRDQARRALIFHIPGVVFFGVDVFNRTVFLPFFETMQHKFAQLGLSAVISFFGELALANFYGSIFLPATHKATIIFAEFGYNVSYQTGRELPSEEEPPEEISQESEDGVRVLLELEGPSNSDLLQGGPTDCTAGTGLGRIGPPDTSNIAQSNSGNGNNGFDGEANQRTSLDWNSSTFLQQGATTFETQSRGTRLGSKASTFASATRRSRILAPIVAPVEYIPPSRPYVPIRPDGPDPLEFDKILCWLAIVWDAWRYLLIRTVLLKSSSIWLYLLMVLKDFSFSYWHFGYSFMERRVLIVIEGATTEERTSWGKVKHFLFKFFQVVIVRPFLLTKFLATTVWRTEVIFGMNEQRQRYSQNVYEDPRKEPREQHISVRNTLRHAGGRKPTASDWAAAISAVAAEKGRQTKGFVGSLFSDLWTHLVLNIRRDWRQWRCKGLNRYKHPVDHWKQRLHARMTETSDNDKQEGSKYDGLEVRYSFANECCIIRHVPPKPKTPKSRSASQILARNEEPHRPSSQSVFRRINAAWLSKVVKEIQSLIFNRCWPRLLQKIMSSSVLIITELFTYNTIVGLLPSFQEYGLFKDTTGRFRVIFMFCIDVVEVSIIWYTQSRSRFYDSIRKGYNLFHNSTMICLCIFNCAAQIMNFAMLRYIRFAPICGDKRVLPDNVQQDMLKNLNLVKYWDQPDL
ncbi:uncharacterized protein LOC34617591 [Cyclospora cayetanensis]|uniref:Uncharacterized protein LOC34617591 n=1 Tax=Cyclospora cayetanensis TaxID=88456 RepID=A0A6P6RUB5_9EIME|nr:uncharacterized protein LOC34617591 [Cyclospora cayetanensis]